MKQTCTWVRFAFLVSWAVALCSLVVDVVISAQGRPLPLEKAQSAQYESGVKSGTPPPS